MKINGKDYKFPEQLGEFMWDSLYQVDAGPDKQGLVNLLEEKLKPLWDTAIMESAEAGWERGFEYGYSAGEDHGWTEGYRAAADDYEG
jgi:hypothetical protein